MTNDEINRFIHTEIVGGCWHEWGSPEIPMPYRWVVVLCKKCRVGRDGLMDGHFNPDYCSDSSPRSLLNEVVAKVVECRGTTRYDDGLLEIAKDDVMYMGVAEWSMLHAETIARACVEAWKSTTGETKC